MRRILFAACVVLMPVFAFSQAVIAFENKTHDFGTIKEADGRVSVDFVRCDMLQEGPSGHFDLIVSNPPYVTLQEKNEMRPNVLRYEPHRALFVPDDDPLVFYRAIAEYGCRSLNPGGMLWFELNERYGSEVASLLEQSGYSEVAVHDDMFGKQRMAEAVWR